MLKLEQRTLNHRHLLRNKYNLGVRIIRDNRGNLCNFLINGGLKCIT